MSQTYYTYLLVPTTTNFSQYTNVQRGTIFMWFFSIFIVTIVTGIRVVSGQIEAGRNAYQQKPQPSSASNQNFQQQINKAQTTTQEDTGSIKMMKVIDKFNTILVPLTIMFALNLVVGVTYAFSLVLYFIVALPMVLFNLLGLHKRIFDHKVFICICENLWLIFSFFWMLNIWVTGKYQQPYYMYEVAAV